jgi:hypothetical protein
MAARAKSSAKQTAGPRCPNCNVVGAGNFFATVISGDTTLPSVVYCKSCGHIIGIASEYEAP